MKAKLSRLVLALALALGIMAGGAAHFTQPTLAAAKHCHTLDMADWWVVTGQISEYGGTLCH